MADTIDELNQRRIELHAALSHLGDFRQGCIRPTKRRCGKPNCWCARTPGGGHPQWLRTLNRNGKNVAQVLHEGVELDLALQHEQNWKRFNEIFQELADVAERICVLKEGK